jgi:uridine kinase
LDDVVATIMDRPGPVRLVAVDGCGGAGKSTFAEQLAAAAGGAPVIHTDDFASWDDPLNWWPRMLTQVVEPLARGDAARYQRYDWPTGQLAEWITVDPAPIIIIEGVSSGRSEWSEHLSFLVWVDAPAETRLSRGLERDGQSALGEWQSWMATEDAHYREDATRERADLEIDGTSSC